MTFPRSFLTLAAVFVLTAGVIMAHGHKKVAAAAGCNMPCCAHAALSSAPSAPCPMAENGETNGSAPKACAHAGSAPAACAHHGSTAMACGQGSAPMACAHHDSAPIAAGNTGCHGETSAPAVPAAVPTTEAAAPAPVPAGVPAKEAAAPKSKGDGVKSCPVSGDEVDPKVTATINGRVVKFCCLDCKKNAEAHPDAFIGSETGVPAS